MQTLEYRTIDKAQWPRGEWDAEPDKKQWRDEATGLPCLIVRNRFGVLCGYVGVNAGHPAFAKKYDDVQDLDVHGGLTFAGPCVTEECESKSICHKTEPGEDDHVWWLGFDCAHAYDFMPGFEVGLPPISLFKTSYRNFAFVAMQVQYLAAQLAAMPVIAEVSA